MICIKVLCFSMKGKKFISFLFIYLSVLPFCPFQGKQKREKENPVMPSELKKKNLQANLNEEKNVF